MVEYILGIGHLNLEECEQVMNDVTRRMKGLKDSVSSIQNEINHLNTIAFQVESRKREIIDHKKNVERVLYNKIRAFLNDGRRWDEIFLYLQEDNLKPFVSTANNPTWEKLKTWYEIKKVEFERIKDEK